ncbi:unnamed protein product [Prunus armeniaca]
MYRPRLETVEPVQRSPCKGRGEQQTLSLVAEALAPNCRLEGVEVRQRVLHTGIEGYAQRLHLPVRSGLLDALGKRSRPKFSPVRDLGSGSLSLDLVILPSNTPGELPNGSSIRCPWWGCTHRRIPAPIPNPEPSEGATYPPRPSSGSPSSWRLV